MYSPREGLGTILGQGKADDQRFHRPRAQHQIPHLRAVPGDVAQAPRALLDGVHVTHARAVSWMDTKQNEHVFKNGKKNGLGTG